MICDVCDDGQRACVCSARQPAMTTAQRDQAALTLLTVMALMDPDETIGSQKIFRFSCPSLAPLFREGEGDALSLDEAVRRLLDVEVQPADDHWRAALFASEENARVADARATELRERVTALGAALREACAELAELVDPYQDGALVERVASWREIAEGV